MRTRGVCRWPRQMVKCWDLEANKVIRHYHGHLSGVYSLALHPTLDVLITAGRDASARVWDMRTKAQVHVLAGHTGTVGVVRAQASDPQVITGSMDSTVRLWDLAAGRTLATLTHHKKSVRALDIHPTEFSFVSGSAGGNNIKKWKCPEGTFVCNFSGHDAIINTMSVNAEGVLFSGGACLVLSHMLMPDGSRLQPTTARSRSGTTTPARRSRTSRTSRSRAHSRPRRASSARRSTRPAPGSSPAARTRPSRFVPLCAYSRVVADALADLLGADMRRPVCSHSVHCGIDSRIWYQHRYIGAQYISLMVGRRRRPARVSARA
jgi:hypothetical protein